MSQSISDIIKVLKGTPNQQVMKNCFTNLSNMATKPENYPNFFKLGAVDIILKYAEDPDPEIRLRCCCTILNLSVDENNRSQLIQMGATKKVLSNLKFVESCPQLRVYSFSALNMLAHDPQATEEFKASSDAFSTVLETLNGFVNLSDEILGALLGAVLSLSADEEIAQKFGEGGGISTMKSLLDLKQDDEETMDKICGCLANFSIFSNFQKIREEGIIPIVCKLLTSENEGIVDKSMNVIANLAQDDENTDLIRDSKGIEPLIEILDSENQERAQVAVSCLWNLSHNETNRTVIYSFNKFKKNSFFIRFRCN
jgi:hypothetical protein